MNRIHDAKDPKQKLLRHCIRFDSCEVRRLTQALGSVRPTPEKFENAALFLRLGLPSTLIRHENEPFRKRWHDDNYVISLTEFSSNTNPK